MAGLLLCAVGLFLMSRLHSDASYLPDVLPLYLIIGLGMGAAYRHLHQSSRKDGNS